MKNFRQVKLELDGNPLTMREYQVYSAIGLSGEEPVSAKQVFESVYHVSVATERDEETIYALVHKIREKLGPSAIRTYDEGYTNHVEILRSKYPAKER